MTHEHGYTTPACILLYGDLPHIGKNQIFISGIGNFFSYQNFIPGISCQTFISGMGKFSVVPCLRNSEASERDNKNYAATMSGKLVPGNCYCKVDTFKVYEYAKRQSLFVKTTISRGKEVEFRCKVNPVRGAPCGDENDPSWKTAKKITLDHSCDPLMHIEKPAALSALQVSALLIPRLHQEGTVPSGIGIDEKATEDLKSINFKSNSLKGFMKQRNVCMGKKKPSIT